jgi:hypothetical protein
MSRKSQETIGPSMDIRTTTESNAFQHERFQEPFAASDGGRFCEVQSSYNKRRGELILMNFKSDVDKSAVEAGKRAALIVVVALALALPLQSQQSAQESPIDPTPVAFGGDPPAVPSLSAMNPEPQQTEPAPNGQTATTPTSTTP